jgi:hypothetical protein
MTSQNRPGKQTDSDSTAASGASTEEVLRPFQAASAKFLQANYMAQEAAISQRAQAWLDVQDEVRRVDQEAYQAAMAAMRKHINTIGQSATVSPEEAYAVRARAQLDYEREVRQICAEAQAKVTAIAQKRFGEGGGAGSTEQFFNQRQDAHKAYLADLQQAWSTIQSLDPQIANAIASSILFTINAVGQGT